MENKKNKTSEIEKANSEEVLTVTETVLETDENSDTCIAETVPIFIESMINSYKRISETAPLIHIETMRLRLSLVLPSFRDRQTF